MIDERWILFGVVVQFFGGVSYLVATLRGQVAPNRVTWLLWTLIPMVALTAQLDDGVGMVAVLTLGSVLTPGLVFVASLPHRGSSWRVARLDVVCGVLSVAGVMLWQLSDHPATAVLFSVLADLLAATPTLVKAYLAPTTENHWTYTTAAFSGALTLLAVDRWTVTTYAFPLYVAVLCASLAVLIGARLGDRIREATA